MSSFEKLRDAILGSLTPELTRLGFTFHRMSQRFVKRGSKGVVYFYQILFSHSPPFIRVDVHIAIRLDSVEKIFHRTSGYEKKYQNETPTMGGSLDAITGNPELKMLLDLERGAQQAKSLLFSQTMMTFYEEWYSRFSQIENIDRELNDAPTRETPNRSMPWLRCSTGIIVAKLSARPDYDSLASVYIQIMQGFSNGFYWPRFEDLLRDIEENLDHFE